MGPVRRKVTFALDDAGHSRWSSPAANPGRRSSTTRYWDPSQFKIPPPPENASAGQSAAEDLGTTSKNASALVPPDSNPARVRHRFTIPPPPTSNPVETASISHSPSPAQSRQGSEPSRPPQHAAGARNRPRHRFQIPPPPSPTATGPERTNASASSGTSEQGMTSDESAGILETATPPSRKWMESLDDQSRKILIPGERIRQVRAVDSLRAAPGDDVIQHERRRLQRDGFAMADDQLALETLSARVEYEDNPAQRCFGFNQEIDGSLVETLHHYENVFVDRSLKRRQLLLERKILLRRLDTVQEHCRRLELQRQLTQSRTFERSFRSPFE